MRIDVNKLPEFYRRQCEEKTSRSDRPTRKAPHMESTASIKLLEKKGIARCNGQVSIRVLSKRKRLADSDGISSKYAIDALVDCGVLSGDGPEIVKEVTHSQIKSQTEETIISIYEADLEREGI